MLATEEAVKYAASLGIDNVSGQLLFPGTETPLDPALTVPCIQHMELQGQIPEAFAKWLRFFSSYIKNDKTNKNKRKHNYKKRYNYKGELIAVGEAVDRESFICQEISHHYENLVRSNNLDSPYSFNTLHQFKGLKANGIKDIWKV
jgi:hypothetical protein